MFQSIEKYYQLIHLVERLKCEKRHSWLSNGDQESVAEHAYRLCLMVLFLAPYSPKKIDVDKAIKMALIHDLPEIYYGDHPAFEITSQNKAEEKFNGEKEALIHLLKDLTEDMQVELVNLWVEFEEAQTPESLFVRGVDRLECHLQHLEADISTWSDLEKKRFFIGMGYYANKDPLLKQFADYLVMKTHEKMKQAGIDIGAFERWKKRLSEQDLLQEIRFIQNLEQ